MGRHLEYYESAHRFAVLRLLLPQHYRSWRMYRLVCLLRRLGLHG